MRAILTGFDLFGSYSFNPTKDMALEYDGKKVGDVEITGLVLPCTYTAFNDLSRKIDEVQPDIILGTGFASRIPRISLEVLGKNIMGGKYPDATGFKARGGPIINGDRTSYQTNVDNPELRGLLSRNDISADVSFDAEGFVCNALIYLTARRIFNERLPIKFCYFHTPATKDYREDFPPERRDKAVFIEKDDLRKTIEILLTGIVEES